MNNALTNAAMTSTRASPKECRSEIGRRAIMFAISANNSDAESVAMCPASASSASDPDQSPAINSINAKPSVSETAIRQRASTRGTRAMRITAVAAMVRAERVVVMMMHGGHGIRRAREIKLRP